MKNYKTEQEKQDKEFEERFCYKSIAKQLIVTYDLCKNPVKLREYLKSYLLSRDQALLEAIIKDLEDTNIIEQDNGDGFVPPLAMSMYATGFRDFKSQIIEHLKLNK